MPRRYPTREDDRERHAAFIANLEKVPEFNILSSLVDNPESTPADAVQRILTLGRASLTKTSREESDIYSNHFYNTALCVIELGMRHPAEKHPKLVDFVHKLQETTVLSPKTGEPLRINGDLVWKELPTFGFSFVDEWYSKSPLDPSNTPHERTQYENLNALLAHLTAASSTIYTNFSVYGTFSLRSAFGPWSTPPASTHYAVRIACLWYIYAADVLFARIEVIANAKDEDLPEHLPQWDREEWDRYKQALRDSQARIRNLETRKMIEEALVAVRRAERGGD